MTKFTPHQERLLFLAKVVRREIKHLQSTDNRLFAQPLTLALVAQLDSDEDLAERVEAFISRFGRLQDTLGDKLLPNLLAFVGERTATAVDNLDRAERLGWIKSSDSWMETRKLRNQMVHEYIEAPEVLADAINLGHERVADLIYAATRMLTEIENRISGNSLI
ncbi:hypothetical protein [Methylobacter tundripaludum]|uniref:hypothetical protein n=1 Tax=Methylobacter tundripaludum TaxID=173365 RepID=UPI0004DF0763|nr:hypothetical protein [Methylobacter tundripaludum]